MEPQPREPSIYGNDNGEAPFSSSKSYHADLINSLKDPQEAAAYLDAVLEDGSFEEVRLALANITEAQILVSEDVQLVSHRRAIHEMLSQQDRLDFATLLSVLSELGFRMTVVPREDAA